MTLPLHPRLGEQVTNHRRIWEWDGARWKKGKPRLEARIIAPVLTEVTALTTKYTAVFREGVYLVVDLDRPLG